MSYIRIHPHATRTSYDHLKLDPMRVLEDVLVREIPIHAINQVPAFRGEFSQKMFPISSIMSSSLRKKIERESSTYGALGLPQIIWHLLWSLDRISCKPTKGCSSKIIGRRLSAIRQFHLGFHEAIFVENQPRISHHHVCTQLSFSRIHAGLDARFCCLSGS